MTGEMNNVHSHHNEAVGVMEEVLDPKVLRILYLQDSPLHTCMSKVNG